MIDDDEHSLDEPTLADEALDLIRRARLAGASDLAVRVLKRLGRGDVALCRDAETEDDVYRWLAVWLVVGHDTLARVARGGEP